MKLPHPWQTPAIAQLVGGRHEGPPVEIDGVAPLSTLGAAELGYLEKGAAPALGVVFAKAALPDRTTIVVDDPLAAMVVLLRAAVPDHKFEGPARIEGDVHPSAVIAAGVEIGAGTIVYPNVVVYPGVRIGRNCRIHAGSVIGADGFRFHAGGGGLLKVPQVAGVQIGDSVEIGALCTIDRGFLEDTMIGGGCKLDNMVHVGHNCRLGRYVVVAAQTGISGSVTIGDGAILGGQVGVVDHVEIGAGARIGAGSGVHSDVPAGETWLGSPARNIRETRRIWASWKYLPEIVRKLG